MLDRYIYANDGLSVTVKKKKGSEKQYFIRTNTDTKTDCFARSRFKITRVS